LIVVSINGNSFLSWLLRNRVTIFLGDISYSVYLIHWPLLLFVFGPLEGKFGAVPRPLAGFVVLASVILLASLVHSYVERPARDWIKARSSRRAPTADANAQ
jgi:peptidoglycan/LPS O-acetylase OafA/YrhL